MQQFNDILLAEIKTKTSFPATARGKEGENIG